MRTWVFFSDNHFRMYGSLVGYIKAMVEEPSADPSLSLEERLLQLGKTLR